MVEEGQDAKKFKKIRSECWKPFIIALILAALIPESETSYEMLAASIITPNNIEIVGSNTTNLVDYIIDSVNKINDDNILDKK